MSRSVSTDFRRAAFAETTGEAVLELLTLEHASFSEPLRVVNNGADITSRTHLFQATRFSIAFPDVAEGKTPAARLSICNVDRRIVDAVRGLEGSPTCTLEVVLASSPDMVEVSYEDLTFEQIEYDAIAVQGELNYERLLNEPFPSDQFGPSIFPGLFR